MSPLRRATVIVLSSLALSLGAGLAAVPLGTAAPVAAAHEGHGGGGDHDSTDEPAAEPGLALDQVDPTWWAGDDVLVDGRGTEDGFTVYVAHESERYAARPVATIRPGGDDGDTWLGYVCVTGSGRYAIANVAQRWTTNEPALRDRGGLLYSVDLATGRVRALAAGVAFKFHAVGCGVDDQVSFVRHLGSDQTRSQIFLGGATGGLRLLSDRRGQLISPVPVRTHVLALRDQALVRLGAGGERRVAPLTGRPYALRANQRGGVDLLSWRGARTAVLRAVGGRVRTLGAGPSSQVSLLSGRAGRTFATGTTTSASRQAAGFRALPLAADIPSLGVSALGKVIVTAAPRTSDDQEPVADDAARAPDGEADEHLVAAGPDARVYYWRGQVEPLAIEDPAGEGEVARSLPAAAGAPARPARSAGTTGAGPSLARSSAGTASAATPTCGVPRNQPNRQAYSPIHNQADWAVQQASRNLLKNGLGRPANYLNTGLAAYSPSNDFPVPTLAGGGGNVPPAVMNAVLAQESAYRHASRRTLPGNGGNPLVGDYYGAAGTIDFIRYDESDCGYGIAQVTSGMRADEGSITPNGKTKVALDYAENIQAGLNILAKKWNQLYAAGIRMNDSDPNNVNNWYTSLWAYNSGVQPTAAFGNTTNCTPSPSCTDPHGHWGLGWTNNPLNPDYPPDREVFLRTTYADAEHPGDWAYQERVLGFAETPIFNYHGDPAYAGTTTMVSYPSAGTFCTSSNACDPNLVNEDDPSLSYCTRVDNHCWWHEPVTTSCEIAGCPTSPFSVAASAAEPAGDNPWPPSCDALADVGSAAVIVDDLPDPSKNLFCPQRDWSNQGSFTYTVGTTTAPDGSQLPIGAIDLHQIATGLGAHTWFAGNRAASDAAHRVTGTWTPSGLTTGPHVVRVHIPRKGSSTSSATYKITLANGSVVTETLNQHEHYDHWKTLGVYQLGPGSKVELTNVTGEVQPGSATVAFDAMAFVPAPGTIKRATVDAVAFFDEDTNIDTNGFASIFVETPIESRQKLYDWASDTAYRVLNYPVCSSGLADDECIRPATRAAFDDWMDEVLAAGATNDVTRWIAFANKAADRPTSTARPGHFLTDDSSYKIRTRVTVSYVLHNGAIVPGTADASYDDRTADTHLAHFMTAIFEAIEDDYGIDYPDLSYARENLNEYDHQTRPVDPRTDGILPGQAMHPVAKKATQTGSCVAVLYTAGGTIGYRPMQATEYVPAAVEGWRNTLDDRAGDDFPEDTLEHYANELYETFFQKRDWVPTGSAFNAAPPIWQELSFRYCADDTVRQIEGLPADYPILRQSFMPNAYLYRDGVAMSQTGGARSSSAPILYGDFNHFSRLPDGSNSSPYGDCDYATGRSGNPWGVSVPTAVDNFPDEAHFCLDDQLGTDPDYQ